jgi:peptidoglycan hydrolase-like protein with peptidoglycan-binding domain
MMPHHWRLLAAFWCALGLLGADVSGISMVYAAPSEANRPTAGPPSSGFIKSLQRELKRAGHDPGVMDGKMGPATRQALRRFQEAHGLSPTGNPDIPTLTKLLGQGLPQ